MNAWIGGALAVAAMFLGGGLWGWKGVILALTGIVFWLLLQFSRLMRAMRAASESPVGQVHSAVMLNSQLRAGMTVAQIITLTRSLGRKLSDKPETFGWIDAGGDQVAVVLQKGKVQSWELLRSPEDKPSPPDQPSQGPVGADAP